MSDQDETTEARLEALESLIRRALGGGGDAPLAGDVVGPETATVLAHIAALAGGGNRLVGVDNAGNVVADPVIQRGTATIVANGFITIAARITAVSRIFVQIMDFNPGGGPTVEFDVPAANRVLGNPGSFRVRAATTGGGATQPLDVSSFDWMIID